MIESGMKAPPFCLLDQNGQRVRLRSFRGKRVLTIFYIEDGSPGCTRELLAFSQARDRLREKGICVLAVSRDSVQSHAGFSQKYGLDMPLLADTEGKTASAWGAVGRNDAPCRTAAIVDKEGFIEKIWREPDPDAVCAAVLGWLDKR